MSRRLQALCLDDKLWKQYCFDSSAWYHFLTSRRQLQGHSPTRNEDRHDALGDAASGDDEDEETKRQQRHAQKLQDMATWDPAFPDEHVSWYDEYIQREGPACVNWLETPRMRDRDQEAIIETRGLALYAPYDGDDGIGTTMAVAPLDDGSVCLWDVNGARGRRGGIIGKSHPDLLYKERSGGHNERLRSQRIDSSIADRVSVDNFNHKAYMAVQSSLIEIDLHRLDVVSRDAFEWSITTLSSIHPDKPLAVGTSLGVHLHDFRTRMRGFRDALERVDSGHWEDTDVFKAIFDPNPLPPYASLSQPTPTSILYLPTRDDDVQVTDDIYVSGRFSNILHYDRRKFPAIVNSIHSGATVNSLTALPYPFYPTNHPRKNAGLGAEGLAEMKAQPGGTLVAAGSYNQKGSLELYSVGVEGIGTDRALKNRHTAASSPLLFMASHGTKLVTSDGSGHIKWFERDGLTECRRLRVGRPNSGGGSNQGSRATATTAPAHPDDEVARKIVSTRTARRARPNNDNVLFWTGERLGMVSFTTSTLFDEEDFRDPEASEEEQKRREYSERMREALEKQANEVRFLSSLGMGTRRLFG